MPDRRKTLLCPAPRSERAPDLLDAVALDDVAGPHVLVVLEGHAAFLTGHDLAHLVLEAAERGERAFVHDDVVAQQPDPGAALHHAVGHAAARHLAALG